MPKLILGRVHVFVQHMILLEFQSALISRQTYLVSFPFSSIHSNHVYLSWFTENDMKTLIQLNPLPAAAGRRIVNPSYSSLPTVVRRDMSRTSRLQKRMSAYYLLQFNRPTSTIQTTFLSNQVVCRNHLHPTLIHRQI